MKTIQPFAHEDSFGMRFYERGENVGYISIQIEHKICDNCEDCDCDFCTRKEDSATYYQISTTYPLEGFTKDEFYTSIDNKNHVYYQKEFDDANEAMNVFMTASQNLMN